MPVAEMSMFEKFEKALKMDEKGTPRNAIIVELDVSSATFYKWIKNPEFWADRYASTPESLMRTTKEIVHSVKKKDASLSTVRTLMHDLELNEYELEFMYQYIHKRNSTEAMLRTLPPGTSLTRQSAKIKAMKLMQRKTIRQGIDRIMQWELEGIHMTLANDIIGQLYRMAFYDPAMFIDGAGKSRYKTLDDIPEEYRCCVMGIKTVFHPKDVTKIYYDIQLVDRQVAMKELMQYANLYEDNNKGLKSIGEGIKKMADLMSEYKNGTVEGDFTNVPTAPPVPKIAIERAV